MTHIRTMGFHPVQRIGPRRCNWVLPHNEADAGAGLHSKQLRVQPSLSTPQPSMYVLYVFDAGCRLSCHNRACMLTGNVRKDLHVPER